MKYPVKYIFVESDIFWPEISFIEEEVDFNYWFSVFKNKISSNLNRSNIVYVHVNK